MCQCSHLPSTLGRVLCTSMNWHRNETLIVRRGREGSRAVKRERLCLQLCIHPPRYAPAPRRQSQSLADLLLMEFYARPHRDCCSERPCPRPLTDPSPFSPSSTFLPLVVTLARPVQPQRLVHIQLPQQAVKRGEDGGEQDDADGDQLRGDLLEGADALGDGVG